MYIYSVHTSAGWTIARYRDVLHYSTEGDSSKVWQRIHMGPEGVYATVRLHSTDCWQTYVTCKLHAWQPSCHARASCMYSTWRPAQFQAEGGVFASCAAVGLTVSTLATPKHAHIHPLFTATHTMLSALQAKMMGKKALDAAQVSNGCKSSSYRTLSPAQQSQQKCPG